MGDAVLKLLLLMHDPESNVPVPAPASPSALAPAGDAFSMGEIETQTEVDPKPQASHLFSALNLEVLIMYPKPSTLNPRTLALTPVPTIVDLRP